MTANKWCSFEPFIVLMCLDHLKNIFFSPVALRYAYVCVCVCVCVLNLENIYI